MAVEVAGEQWRPSDGLSDELRTSSATAGQQTHSQPRRKYAQSVNRVTKSQPKDRRRKKPLEVEKQKPTARVFIVERHGSRFVHTLGAATSACTEVAASGGRNLVRSFQVLGLPSGLLHAPPRTDDCGCEARSPHFVLCRASCTPPHHPAPHFAVSPIASCVAVLPGAHLPPVANQKASIWKRGGLGPWCPP